MRVTQVQLDELFALLSAVKAGEVNEAQTISRLSRSPHWVWVAMAPVSKLADRKFSATRLCWSKGIGGGDAFMKLCASSSGCKSRPTKGEPAQVGSEPGDSLRNRAGEAE